MFWKHLFPLTQNSKSHSLCVLERDTLIQISVNYWWISMNPVSSVAQSCPTLCDPMDYSMPGFLLCPSPTPRHWLNSCLLNQWCPPTISSSVIPFSSCLLSQHQGLFWVSSSHQFSSVAQSCLTLRSYGLQQARLPCPSPTPRVYPTHVHWVGDASQPSHPLSSPSPPAFNLS